MAKHTAKISFFNKDNAKKIWRDVMHQALTNNYFPSHSPSIGRTLVRELDIKRVQNTK